MAKVLKPFDPAPELLVDALESVSAGDVSPELMRPAEWLAVAHLLEKRRDVAGLKTLESSVKHKTFQKALRRIFHKLRSSGLAVQAARPAGIVLGESRGVTHMAAYALTPSLCGTFVAAGGWSISGLEVLTFTATFGPDFEMDIRWTDRTSYHQWVRTLRGDGFVPISEAYLGTLMGLALAEHRRRGREVGPDFMSATMYLGPREVPGEHPIGEVLAKHGVELPAMVNDSDDLLQGTPLELRYRPEWVKLFADGLRGLQASPAVLEPLQQRDRVEAIIDGVVGKMTDRVGVESLSLSLRHGAMLALFDGGLIREAATLARLAELLEEGVEPGTVPLFRAPFERLLVFAPSEDEALSEILSPSLQESDNGPS